MIIQNATCCQVYMPKDNLIKAQVKEKWTKEATKMK